MKFSFSLMLLFLLQFVFSQQKLPLIPYPQKVEIKEGFFKMPKDIKVNVDMPMHEANKIFFSFDFFNTSKIIFNKGSKNSQISFGLLPPKIKNRNKDFYKIEVFPEEIIISSETDAGKFYAINSLFQILNFYKPEGKIPCLTIEDSPKFQWRGMHLDCARHFFTKDEVKKYIDYLAMYKFNTFHWHLTDDQGWRIEIKKYPKLTKVGAWRNGSMIGHYSEQKFDDKKYGGFYTQEEIKEVVKYAAERHITIVPEIEMPGHAVAAIASYPWLSCTGKQIEVEKKWGVFDDIFCPKEETFTFLEDVLTEVMALFPSKTIHIGGDEAPKTRWKNCEHCQNLIKTNNLKDEHELQSYFIQRIEKFVNSKGRKIIGWDEILEGGLAPNAAVMSWRGTDGGIAAAKQKHDVVMSPGNYLYFDHYQGDPKNEPLAFGGFNPLEKVYAFNPLPKELNAEEQKYILGAQGNMWTEYMNDFNQVEYMLFPRIMALSEVLWGTSNPTIYNEFQQRVFENFKTLDKLEVNYSKTIFNVASKSEPANNGKDAIVMSLKGFKGSENMYYTTDRTVPNVHSKKYEKPFPINENTLVKAAYFENEIMKSKVMEQAVFVSKSSGKTIILKDLPDKRYFGSGAETLVDGLRGDPAKFGKDWLGFLGDVNAEIDLGKEMNISSVSISFVDAKSSWIHLPKSIEIQVSKDGKNYKYFSSISEQEIKDHNGKMDWLTNPAFARFVKIKIENVGIIPDGFDGSGNKAWLFVDEISLN